MAIPVRKTIPAGHSGLTWMITDDGSRTLRRGASGETYHSGCGAVAESLHVYLRNSGIQERLMAGASCRVFEFGFGTGTAFFLTAALAEFCSTPLHFEAVEIEILPQEVYQQLQLIENLRTTDSPLKKLIGDKWPCFLEAATSVFAGFCRSINEAPDSDLPTDHAQNTAAGKGELERCLHLRLGQHTSLTVHIRPFDSAWFTSFESRYDAVYFDPFSPQTNSELWTEDVFRAMRNSLIPTGTLTTYCVKGDVRRAMEAAGFRVERVAGPPQGKREVLIARP